MTEKFLVKYGPWAIVTGASSGIGAEFVRQLAAQGLNIVLVARRKDRLQKLAMEVTETYRVEALPLDMDLLAPDFLDVVRQRTQDLDIGLLVNNAGMICAGKYFEIGLEEELKMHRLNG